MEPGDPPATGDRRYDRVRAAHGGAPQVPITLSFTNSAPSRSGRVQRDAQTRRGRRPCRRAIEAAGCHQRSRCARRRSRTAARLTRRTTVRRAPARRAARSPAASATRGADPLAELGQRARLLRDDGVAQRLGVDERAERAVGHVRRSDAPASSACLCTRSREALLSHKQVRRIAAEPSPPGIHPHGSRGCRPRWISESRQMSLLDHRNV